MPCDDCSRTDACPPCVQEEPKASRPSRDDPCACGHSRGAHDYAMGCVGNRNLCACQGFRGPVPALKGPGATCAVLHQDEQGNTIPCPEEPEPPLAPEEEEEAPLDRIHPADCVHEDGCPYLEPTCENGCKVAADELILLSREMEPPQPERRPPYAVDYSAGGHGFQILVPGDVSVVAVDGALVIRHHGFPVLGISAVSPLIQKEAN